MQKISNDMRTIVLLSIICFSGLFTQKTVAQDTIKLVEYPLKSVSISPLMLADGPSLYFYQLGTEGELKPVGYRGKNLAHLFKQYPAAHSRYTKSRGASVTASILTYIGLLGFISTFHTGREEFIREHGDNLRNTGLMITLGGLLSGQLFDNLSRKNFRKAVRNYNDALLGRK